MKYISIEEYTKHVKRNNQPVPAHWLIPKLRKALSDKESGAKCICCGAPIWAAGSALTGSHLCFSCITGTTDDSNDYEIIR